MNEKIKLYSVNDKEFSKYGKVIDCDCNELISVAERIDLPQEGSVYLPSVDDFEKLVPDEKIAEIKIPYPGWRHCWYLVFSRFVYFWYFSRGPAPIRKFSPEGRLRFRRGQRCSFLRPRFIRLTDRLA